MPLRSHLPTDTDARGASESDAEGRGTEEGGASLGAPVRLQRGSLTGPAS